MTVILEFPERRSIARRLPRATPLLGGFVLLGLGVVAGLARLGWNVPAGSIAALHGPLMIGGFFGTLLCFERAICEGKRWLMAAPLLTVAGSALALAGSPLGKVAIALASLVLLTPLLRNWNERRSASAALLAGGAAAWLAGNLLWLGGWPIPLVVWWWRAFLLLSIAGDRLALAGLEAGGGRPRRGAPRALWLCVLYLFAVSLLAGLILPALGATMIGLAMVVLAACLLASDRTARRELADRGAARYTGLGVLVAYGWLAAGGALVMILLAVLPAMTLGRSEWLEYLPGAGPLYDAALHAAFVGFALGMVFAHAPRVFPRFLGRPLTFTRAFYLPWTLLQLTLVARIVADIAGSGTLRPWAGAGNALAIALFALTMAIAVARGTPSR